MVKSSLGLSTCSLGRCGRGGRAFEQGAPTGNELRDLVNEDVECVVELETDCRHFVVAVKLRAAAEGSYHDPARKADRVRTCEFVNMTNASEDRLSTESNEVGQVLRKATVDRLPSS